MEVRGCIPTYVLIRHVSFSIYGDATCAVVVVMGMEMGMYVMSRAGVALTEASVVVALERMYTRGTNSLL